MRFCWALDSRLHPVNTVTPHKCSARECRELLYPTRLLAICQIRGKLKWDPCAPEGPAKHFPRERWLEAFTEVAVDNTWRCNLGWARGPAATESFLSQTTMDGVMARLFVHSVMSSKHPLQCFPHCLNSVFGEDLKMKMQHTVCSPNIFQGNMFFFMLMQACSQCWQRIKNKIFQLIFFLVKTARIYAVLEK